MKVMNVVFFLSVMALIGCSREKSVVEESYPDGSPKKVCLYTGSGENRQLIRETTYYPKRKLQMDVALYVTPGFKRDGIRVGKWKFFDETGKLLQEVNYSAPANTKKQ